MWQPDVMIFHAPCDDGFGAAWAAWKRWGDSVEYVGAAYKQEPPDLTGKHVLIGDFSYKAPVIEAIAKVASSVVILDHHKSAEAELAAFRRFADNPERFTLATVASMLSDLQRGGHAPVCALFDMERSGARMVWDFCHPDAAAPLLIRYVEDRDLWRFDLAYARAVSLYLRSFPYSFDVWATIAERLEFVTGDVMAEACAIERFYDRQINDLARTWQTRRIDGHDVPTVNCGGAFASDVGHALLTLHPDAPFAATYSDRHGGRGYSLRSEDHRLDVSLIARRYGGGGHRNAAGFEVPG